MLVFITHQKKIKKIDYLISTLKKEFPHLTTVIQNINSRHDNVILGDEVKVIDGPGYIEDQLLGNTYRISVKIFFTNVNLFKLNHLYQKQLILQS